MAETREFQDNRTVQGEGALKGGEPSGNGASDLANSVARRFGVFPNFFRLAPETPEIIEKLWAFTQAAYVDNPLPSIFKERLFVRKRLTNTLFRQAGSVLKCPDDRKNRVVSAQATDTSRSSAVSS